MSLNEVENQKNPIVKKLDIRGKLCPMTFVYTKLALEEMDQGEILEVTLDFPPAIENIPESCRRQRLAELLVIKEIDGSKKTWQLTLKKS